MGTSSIRGDTGKVGGLLFDDFPDRAVTGTEGVERVDSKGFSNNNC